MGMNVWGQPLKKDEDLFTGTFENPEAPEIDNSPGFMAQLVQGFLKAGATAAGGAAGGAAADAVSDSYNASQEMPAGGAVQGQRAMQESTPLSLASVYTEKDRRLPLQGGTPMNFSDRYNFPNFVGPMQPDFYNSNSKYYQGGYA